MLRRIVILSFVMGVVGVQIGRSQPSPASSTSLPLTAIKAGRLIDPETGTAAVNQVILVEGEKIKAVGPGLAIPP